MRRNPTAAQEAAQALANLPADLKAERDALRKEASDIVLFGKEASEEYKTRAKALNVKLRQLGMVTLCLAER